MHRDGSAEGSVTTAEGSNVCADVTTAGSSGSIKGSKTKRGSKQGVIISSYMSFLRTRDAIKACNCWAINGSFVRPWRLTTFPRVEALVSFSYAVG